MKRLFSLSASTIHFRRVPAPVLLLALLFALAACGGGGGGGGGSNNPGTGNTDCVLDTSAKLDSCKLG